MIVLILIIAFFKELFLTLVPLVGAIFLYKKLRRKHKTVGISVLILIISIEIYRWFIAFNPTDRFYQKEFVHAAGFSLPEDAEIIAKKSIVPSHLHIVGYEATFLVKCNKQGYQQLMHRLSKDASFSVVKEMTFWSDWREEMLWDNKLNKASIIYFKQTQAGETIYLEFFTTQNLVLVCKNSI